MKLLYTRLTTVYRQSNVRRRPDGANESETDAEEKRVSISRL